MKQLGTWLYVSRSTLNPDDAGAAVAAIVDVSRTRNAELEVTGALAFAGAAFAQYLEGPAESVQALRASIMRDPRHDHILTLEEGVVAQRLFANWSLAYTGNASYFGRVLERIRQDQPDYPSQSARELTRMLRELANDSGPQSEPTAYPELAGRIERRFGSAVGAPNAGRVHETGRNAEWPDPARSSRSG